MDAAAALRKARTREEMPPVIVGELRQQLDVEQAVLVLGSPPEHPYSNCIQPGAGKGRALRRIQPCE